MPTFPVKRAPKRAVFKSKLTLDARFKPFYTDRDGQQCAVGEKEFKGYVVTFDDGYTLFAMPHELEYI